MTMPGTDPPPAKPKRKQWRKGASDPSSPVAIARKERDAQALELKAQGKSYTYIACELGYYDAAHAQKMVTAELQKVTREPAIALVNLHVARLDMLHEKAMQIVADAEDPETALKAIKECRDNAMDSAKLLGIVKQKIDVEVSPPREQLWERVAGWLSDPTEELERALEAAGWVRVASALPAHGEPANDVESDTGTDTD